MISSSRSPFAMSVADLKAALADLPDWAAVQVVIGYDDADYPQERGELYVDYSGGVLTIDVA
jgi:hypothetical protein